MFNLLSQEFPMRNYGSRYGLHALYALMAVLAVTTAIVGCSNRQWEDFRAQSDSLNNELQQAKDEANRLLGENDVLADALADAQAAAPAAGTPEHAAWAQRVSALEEQIAGLKGKVTDAQERVNEYATKLSNLNAAIQAAETPEEGAAAIVATGGTIIGTATGQPAVVAVASLLSSLLTWLGTRKREQAKGAALVATGIEATRNDTLEQHNPGFVIFEKAGAAIAHKAAGVASAIAKATE